MDAFSTLQLLGWVTIGLVFFLFAATGGFDFGAGMLAPFLGKTDSERRVVINSVGPTWDGNQVWLITAGGALFAIWPRVYAASFSGFYFAMMLVLWTLFLRPVSFEYRHQIDSEKWRTFWDWGLFVGSVVPSFIIGVAVGNLFLGVPFHYDEVTLRFFYDGWFWGLLRPFPIFVGLVSVCMIAMHGAAYLQLRTDGIILQRSKIALKYASSLLATLFAIAGLWMAFGIKGFALVNPHNNMMLHPLQNQVELSTGAWLSNYSRHPWMLIAPLLGLAGPLVTNQLSMKGLRFEAFCASVASVFGVIFTWGLSMFPFVMPSFTHPKESLLAWNATSSMQSLKGILLCAVIMVPVIFFYTGFVYRKLWGRGERMSVARVERESHNLY